MANSSAICLCMANDLCNVPCHFQLASQADSKPASQQASHAMCGKRDGDKNQNGFGHKSRHIWTNCCFVLTWVLRFYFSEISISQKREKKENHLINMWPSERKWNGKYTEKPHHPKFIRHFIVLSWIMDHWPENGEVKNRIETFQLRSTWISNHYENRCFAKIDDNHFAEGNAE